MISHTNVFMGVGGFARTVTLVEFIIKGDSFIPNLLTTLSYLIFHR